MMNTKKLLLEGTFVETFEGRYACSICAKTFKKRNISCHWRLHTGERPFQCAYCPLTYRQKGELNRHNRLVHSEEMTDIFICFHCNKTVDTKQKMQRHIAKEHVIQCHEKNFSKNGDKRDSEGFICALCNISLRTRCSLRNHLIKKHRETTGKHVCSECDKVFWRIADLKRHSLHVHKDEKSFACAICGRRLKGHGREHMRLHSLEKPHVCNVCNTAFTQKSALTVHKRVHTGDKPFGCPVCDMKFSHSQVLQMHLRRHTGEKPYKCLICRGVGFSQAQQLKKHMRALHNTEKAFYCGKCEALFVKKKECNIHRKACMRKAANGDEANMTKIRVLLAILMKKIASKQRLDKLRFGKRLIDDVLYDSIQSSGREVYKNKNAAERKVLLKNIDILLRWTIPEEIMQKFKNEKQSTEEILVNLTGPKTN